MNFSHGSYEYHQSVIDNTRKMVAGKMHSLPNWIYLTNFPSRTLRTSGSYCVRYSQLSPDRRSLWTNEITLLTERPRNSDRVDEG